ncbi:hypothetical protein QNI16_35855 [Cytophagaceae bacterium YF14B1]|uniref:Uncharacterized protein n=1 Tax=Xanthocytophaga flava TaxID=3048013 RepID=A0AAE3UBL7_9BACT|nr:hypothetical protein [Xanthocytophaga flavus]MDJ1485912.1 hypothetical protein [Xanthocytophaga flavus]
MKVNLSGCILFIALWGCTGNASTQNATSENAAWADSVETVKAKHTELIQENDSTATILHYDGLGNTVSRERRVNGLLDGVVEHYYPNQTLKRKTVWKKGKQGFAYEEYDPSGKRIDKQRQVVMKSSDTISISEPARFRVWLSDTTKNIVVFIGGHDGNFFITRTVILTTVAITGISIATGGIGGIVIGVGYAVLEDTLWKEFDKENAENYKDPDLE